MSKLTYILTDLFVLVQTQRGTFGKQYRKNLRYLFETIEKLIWMFLEFDVHFKSRESDEYDVDEHQAYQAGYPKGQVCLTMLYKRFLIHVLRMDERKRNTVLKFTDVLRRIVYKDAFIRYLWMEEDYMRNVFLKTIRMDTNQKSKLAKRLQWANTYPRLIL